MGPVALSLFYIGEALVYSAIWFTIVSFCIATPFKQKAAWIKGFFFITIILAIVNFIIENFIFTNMNNDELGKIYTVQSFIIPIFVSIIYWLIIKKIREKEA